ncbi:MAG: hypothetical protein AVDCRST_MAG38-2910 [uncultured Solirubrobacteraceae bacterium]|uniref:Uncharacterized protein n=1 Tax=uncultured Solirubrobacteraceae bacterium TaxID=1162706 RepID=A0A6J4SHH1_9ACTN|nr:MAG: hypothetical protein AVDCRST_MAG38-2910 [uncultured Solirubrobacteraceae bacterium]
MLKPLLLSASALVALVVAVLGAAELLHWRYRRLRRARRADTAAAFAAHFRADAVSDEVALAVRAYFAQVTGLADFPVRPSDDLLGTYNLATEDVQDAVAVIASEVECAPPRALPRDEWRTVHTVADLVGVVHRLRRAVEVGQAAARGRAAARAG